MEDVFFQLLLSGNTIQAAIIKSYSNVEKITWGNNYQQYRKDIAQKAK